jgi:hypothetical protein
VVSNQQVSHKRKAPLRWTLRHCTGRATRYRRPELRAIVEDHRQRDRDAFTLTGLAVQIDQLRATPEALAAKV